MINQQLTHQYLNEMRIWVDGKIAIMEWNGAVPSESYRAGHEAFLNLLHENPYPLWLFDFEKGKYISAEDQQWTVQEWLPKAIGLLPEGLDKIAVIISQDIFNKVAIRIMTAHIWNHNIEIAFFESEEVAVKWLKE